MTITVTDTATGQQLTVREVSAALAVPEQHVSAPYSRAVGLLDRWVRDSRRAADEFAAWIEGQTAQTASEIRRAADEQLHQHRQVRVEIAERNRREGTFNLPPGFLEIAPVWAEITDVQPISLITAERAATLDAMVRLHRGGWTPPPRPIEDFAPAADENIPGRDDTWVALDPTPEGNYVRVGRGVDWRAEWAELADDLGRPLRALRAWWQAKQAQRDERMGVDGDA